MALQVRVGRHDQQVGKFLQDIEELLATGEAEFFGIGAVQGNVKGEHDQFILVHMTEVVGDEFKLVGPEPPRYRLLPCGSGYRISSRRMKWAFP